MSFSTLVGNLDVGLLIDQPALMLGLSSGLLQGLTREEGGVGAHLEGDIGYLLAKQVQPLPGVFMQEPDQHYQNTRFRYHCSFQGNH
jgi:hypothetical protein